jgi:hypothetical protein
VKLEDSHADLVVGMGCCLLGLHLGNGLAMHVYHYASVEDHVLVPRLTAILVDFELASILDSGD